MSVQFSIVIANYNNGKFIIKALNSLESQTFKDFEVIIIDDASTDNSIERINKYIESKSNYTLYQNKQNLGYGATLKKGFLFAKGEILARLDPDDALTKNAIEIMVESHNNNKNASLIYSTYYNCDSELNILELTPHSGKIPVDETYLTLQNNINYHISHFATFKKHFYNKTSGIDACFKKAIDKDLYYKLEEVGKTIFINKPLYYYRQHEGSISLFKNTNQARLWEMRAKEKAYRRRLKTDKKNLNKQDIVKGYSQVYRDLAFDELNKKSILEYLKYISTLFRYMSPGKVVKFIYYSLKRKFMPHKFI